MVPYLPYDLPFFLSEDHFKADVVKVVFDSKQKSTSGHVVGLLVI